MEPIDRLDRYLSHELPPEQLAELERDLRQNPQLQQLLDDLTLSQRAVQIGTIRTEVRLVHAQFMNQLRNEETDNERARPETPVIPLNKSPSLGFGWVMRIAASVLLLLVGFAAYQIVTTNGKSLYANNFVGYEVTTTRGTDAPPSVLENRYRSNDFAGVARQGDTLSRKTVPDLFLHAIALLELQQYKPAISLLEEARKKNGQFIIPFFKPEIDYYQAMAYLADNQYDEALNLLNQIRQDEEHPYRDFVSESDMWKLKVKSWLK